MSEPIDLFGPPKGWLTTLYRRKFIYHVIVAQHEAYRRDFLSWISANFKVWLAFEHEANRLRRRGFEHYGARTIVEWMRHESAVREGPNEQGWKLNNNFIPDLARLYMRMYPEAADFFETRVNPLSVRAA